VASFVIVAGTIVVVDFTVAAVVGAVGGTVVVIGCVVVVVGSTTAVVSSSDVVVPTEATPAVSPAFKRISRHAVDRYINKLVKLQKDTDAKCTFPFR